MTDMETPPSSVEVRSPHGAWMWEHFNHVCQQQSTQGEAQGLCRLWSGHQSRWDQGLSFGHQQRHLVVTSASVQFLETSNILITIFDHDNKHITGPHDGVYGVPDLNALCPDEVCPWLDWVLDLVLDSWEDECKCHTHLISGLFLLLLSPPRSSLLLFPSLHQNSCVLFFPPYMPARDHT